MLLCSGTDIKQTARTQIFRLVYKRESASDQLHPAVNIFTVTCSSHIKWISDLIYAHCTDQIIVRSVACNKLEVSERQLY